MESFDGQLAAILGIGIGSTLIMDTWGFVRKPLLGISPPNYCLVGRWLGHMLNGKFRHQSISASPRLPGECLAGWIAHYLTGIGFASILVCVWGLSWIQQPTISPALAVGLGTLLVPFLLMQPGMGAGIASSKTPRPWAARLQSVITHLVFGVGLYVSGLIFDLVNGGQ